MNTMTVPRRFNGPRDSGNGGYSSGMAASFVDGLAEVSLRSPVPLDTELDVVPENRGVRVMNGETLVMQADSIESIDLEVPDPVSLADARDASSRYRGLRGEVFSSCFICGLDRDDSHGVFAGTVEGRDLVASPWTPPAETADADGYVRTEFIWAALDCPTFFAIYHQAEALPIGFLARMAVRIDGPVRAGEEHVVMSWPLESDGRKKHAGAAVLSAAGETLAVARALMIEAR